MKTIELFNFDCKYLPLQVAGIDEVGRGPLAGPVVVACCIMPLDKFIDKINDSKKINETTRETLYEQIINTAFCYNISIIDHTIIDEINILNATKLAMKNAIDGMKLTPELVLVDAVDDLDVKVKCEAIIKGDAQSYNIAAASIIAKVTRDRMMREFAKLYPHYNFQKNKGYGTLEHIAALKKFGACPIHRGSFIKNFASELPPYDNTH